MNILSIHSHVVYGHVGNSAAVFALQRMGIEVWPVHTVQFSNHPGYGGFRGQRFDGAAIRALVTGLDERGVLGACDGVLSGYLASADAVEAVVDAVAAVKRANPGARFCCDPVIGDDGTGVFVPAEVAELIQKRALPIADVATPNQFELDFLSGRSTATFAQAMAAIDEIHARGPALVLVTSLRLDETPADTLEMVASEHDGERVRLRTPRLPLTVNGAGDLIAALFFARHLGTGSVAEALSLAASSVLGVLCRTAERGAREMLLVDAQEELVSPSRILPAFPI